MIGACRFQCLWSLLILCALSCAADENRALVRLVRTPDSGLQPQLTIDEKGTVHLVYLVGEPANCDVYYRSRMSGQTEFSAPVRVNSQPGTAIAIGTVRGAQIAVAAGHVYVAWNGSDKAKAGHNSKGAMLFSRLETAGNNHAFEPERNLMTHTINLDGGGSVAADKAGNVYVVWHAHEKGGAEEDETHRGVYVARSRDFGATFSAEEKVPESSGGACGCCGLAAFSRKPGELAIVYRAADASANRDMALLLSTDFGKHFARKILGKWKVSICPMSTPALGTGPDGNLLAMWETQGQVYRASINPVRLEEITPVPADGARNQRKHPRFAWEGQQHRSLLMAWVEGTGWQKGGALVWEIISEAKPNQTEGASPRNDSLRSGRAEGVPPWTFTAVVPDPDGSFTLLY